MADATRTSRSEELENAQRLLLDRVAPGTRTGRVRWSGGETQTLELGEGPPVLLLHGGLDNAFTWAPILPALARRRRVIAVDLPGHGLADPFDFTGVDLIEHGRLFVDDILGALELRTSDVIASSVGGLYALALALSSPERLSRLVLVGMPAGAARPGVPFQLRLLALPLVGRPLGRKLMSNPSRDANRKFWGEVIVRHPERLADEQLDADVASQRRNLDSFLTLIGAIADVGGVHKRLILGERWRTLRVPTLMVWGEEDKFARPDVGVKIAGENPVIDLVRVPDAGHLVWHDEPELVVEQVEQFLSR